MSVSCEFLRHSPLFSPLLSLLTSRQQNKRAMQKQFYQWREQRDQRVKEHAATKIADQFYNRTLMFKALRALRTAVEVDWRTRVERACQSKAQQTCEQLRREYEARLAEVCLCVCVCVCICVFLCALFLSSIAPLTEVHKQLANELHESRQHVVMLDQRRIQYEENMKKAFMRGVSLRSSAVRRAAH
jgi:hypothetical protein